MIPPVSPSPLIKTARWSALLVGILYGKQRLSYLKPHAEEDRRIEEEEKKAREEAKRIKLALEDATSILE